MEYFFLAEAGQIEDARRGLSNAFALASDRFTKGAMRLAAGEIVERRFLESAGTAQQAQAHFYMAMTRLIASDKAGTATHFEQCAQLGSGSADLAYAARGRLRRLNAENAK